jgi:hypothetical protein
MQYAEKQKGPTKMTITLDRITKSAEAEANRQQRPMTIWNLNRYSPMYVVRDARDGDSKRDQFVATVEPTTLNDHDTNRAR